LDKLERKINYYAERVGEEVLREALREVV